MASALDERQGIAPTGLEQLDVEIEIAEMLFS
jgi:hypothetical protein